MKYMGSKRAMLLNGLGNLIGQEVAGRSRFIDLFSGSAAVSWHVAERYPVEVLAVDLQAYGTALAEGLLRRTKPLSKEDFWPNWKANAEEHLQAFAPPFVDRITRANVDEARRWCALFPEGSLIYAYGGHYFSPTQISWIEALRETLPEEEETRSIALAALVMAASQAAAAPGHTAQPFQPTKTAKNFLAESWDRDIPELVSKAIDSIAHRHARVRGSSHQTDACKFATELEDGDLVFVDPPYSGVHYSRFYHVLESIAEGETTAVSGVGRYPAKEKRPRSDFSMKTTSATAMENLLKTLAERKTDVILTFPDHDCSNGLSGEQITGLAAAHFHVEKKSVHSVFSTLGGVGKYAEGSRSARQTASELMLLLRSR
jgi:adenine-specific DNA methylase